VTYNLTLSYSEEDDEFTLDVTAGDVGIEFPLTREEVWELGCKMMLAARGDEAPSLN
jgi:hypothetical protein